ncbi:MAG TPA: hypothetical protein VGL61_29045 [Kofleriaceae bacterium]
MRISLIATAAIFGVASVASASGPAVAPTCDSLTNPVYIQCGDTQSNLMLNLGRALRDNTEPITLVWVTDPSCTNINLIYLGGNIGSGSAAPTMSYVPSKEENATWTPATGASTCTLPVGGVPPDIGNSALYISACNPPPQPATVYIGGSPASETGQTQTGSMSPKQGYALAMPRGTNTNAISAEEAYFLFGFGPTMLEAMNAALSPWTDAMQVFIRKSGTSTLLAWGANLQIPGTKFQGVQESGSPQVVSALEGSTSPGAAIGMIGVEVYDTLRAQLQVLAFKAYHQYFAYYPDSTATSRDKQNLRDGHYTVWSPAVWMDFTDGVPTADYPQGTPKSQLARYVIDLIDNQDTTPTGFPAPNFDTQVIVSQVGLVPDCAMRVFRAFEGGPLSLYQPPESCVCKYEATVDVSTCDTCDDSTPCATGVCRDGYCEEF